MNRNHIHGFSLIELISVIVLISIVSLSASSYFSGINSVSAQALQTELLHSLRLTQIRAMNRSGYCNRWLIDEYRAQQISLEQRIENCETSFPNQQTNNAYLDNQDISYVASLAKHDVYFSLQVNSTPITLISPYALDFDPMGRIKQCNKSGCKIVIHGASNQEICIETEGYIHAC
ncbi:MULTISPECIES: Tfp pilus assembly protein FimT/FimU [unclassified Aliivibrio]|uniref:pilus assembly FimT family protein n=1 Tax=unclassified Aliivibrio TaxID=2645654 RepID=UPI00080ED858|nr:MULTISPECIES: type II secretion system protein [unclassified Aliivibrio]OCH16726.1 MSHA biogenesis protein MshC [Aliivibrio sp. 1S165]OCH19137.1 MSHA biogenesis protein MshC [Aliivibrio sp. 1S128]OCH32822.1 MSHA biogenesis protein MshC [Aliivibrio sp. 1S175]